MFRDGRVQSCSGNSRRTGSCQSLVFRSLMIAAATRRKSSAKASSAAASSKAVSWCRRTVRRSPSSTMAIHRSNFAFSRAYLTGELSIPCPLQGRAEVLPVCEHDLSERHLSRFRTKFGHFAHQHVERVITMRKRSDYLFTNSSQKLHEGRICLIPRPHHHGVRENADQIGELGPIAARHLRGNRNVAFPRPSVKCRHRNREHGHERGCATFPPDCVQRIAGLRIERKAQLAECTTRSRSPISCGRQGELTVGALKLRAPVAERSVPAPIGQFRVLPDSEVGIPDLQFRNVCRHAPRMRLVEGVDLGIENPDRPFIASNVMDDDDEKKILIVQLQQSSSYGRLRCQIERQLRSLLHQALDLAFARSSSDRYSPLRGVAAPVMEIFARCPRPR